jgi:hypothetical protein
MNTTNQYVFGGISGMFGILLSHPLDTIKTHIQNGNSLASFKPTIGNAYRGISVPLIGVGIEILCLVIPPVEFFVLYPVFSKLNRAHLGR